MAAFYLDENVPLELGEALAALGHDVMTVQADGRASQGIDDPEVLAEAIELNRAVLTIDRRDYHRLHQISPGHAGIITYTDDTERGALAIRIHVAVSGHSGLAGVLTRIVKPNIAPKQTP